MQSLFFDPFYGVYWHFPCAESCSLKLFLCAHDHSSAVGFKLFPHFLLMWVEFFDLLMCSPSQVSLHQGRISFVAKSPENMLGFPLLSKALNVVLQCLRVRLVLVLCIELRAACKYAPLSRGHVFRLTPRDRHYSSYRVPLLSSCPTSAYLPSSFCSFP